MIPGLSLFGVFSWFRGSLIAQIAAGVIAFMGIWKINNVMVARKTIAKIEDAAREHGRARNEKSADIRRGIKPSGAMRRLRKEYASPR